MGGTIFSQGHELLMMALTAVVSLIVGVIGGRIWQRWQDMREWRGFSENLTEEELTLINAHRVRQEREGDVRSKARRVQ